MDPQTVEDEIGERNDHRRYGCREYSSHQDMIFRPLIHYRFIERLGWPDSSVDSLFCLPPRARCTAQPLVGILIFFPKISNMFASFCPGLTDRQAI